MTNLFDDIDDTDKKIIEFLQTDASMSYTAIGKELDKSQPAIGARVLKLSRGGILGTQKGVNFKTSGLPLMNLDVRSSDAEKMQKRAEVCPFILNSFKKLGDFNFQLFVTASSIEAINEIIDDCYRKDDTLQSIKSSLVVSMDKDFVLPVNFELERYEGYNCPMSCPFNTKELPFDLGNVEPILEIVSRREDIKAYFDKMLFSIKQMTKCDGIGIRLPDREGNIKFYAWKGFSDEFYVNEGEVCVEECLCGKITRGDIKKLEHGFTSHGSFISNKLDESIGKIVKEGEISEDDLRGYCLQQGYQSLALIPIRDEDKTYGMLYLSSNNKSIFSEDIVQTLEHFSNLLEKYLKGVLTLKK